MDRDRQIKIRQGLDPEYFPIDHSRLQLYERCPAQYDFQYNKRLPRTSGEAAGVGIVAHDFLEVYVNHGLAAAKAYVSAMLPMTKHAELEKIQRTIAKIEFKGKPYATERRFHFYAEIAGKKVQFEAKIDILFVYNDQAEVIDGKTGRQLSNNVDDDPQGLFYSLACLRSSELEFFDFNTVIFTQAQFQTGHLATTEFTKQRIEEYEKYLHARVEKIINDTRFKPSPGPHCHWCPYVASACPVGQSIAPELLSIGGSNIKVRATNLEEAKLLAEQAMYLDALLGRLKAGLRGYLGSQNDAPLETDSGVVSIESISNKNIKGGISGVVERHPEEKENVTESWYPRLIFKRK